MDQLALVGRSAAPACSCGRPSYRTDEFPTSQADAPAAPLPARKGRTALLWGVGSTILSVLGFVALALFEQYNHSLSELRTDLKQFNATTGNFAKRESLQKLREYVKGQAKELQLANALGTQLQQELRISEKAREETARELQRMRERLAFLEGRHAAAAASMSQSPHAPGPPKHDTPRE